VPAGLLRSWRQLQRLAVDPAARAVRWLLDRQRRRGQAAYFLKSIVGGARLPETMCNASAFPVDTSGCDYMGLSKINSSSAAECQQSCCAWGAGACSIWQWVPVPDGQ